MYFNDFLAQQVMKTSSPTPARDVDGPQPVRRLLRILWNGVRQLAWGIDAYSRISHGIDVPLDHGARRRLPATTRRPRRP